MATATRVQCNTCYADHAKNCNPTIASNPLSLCSNCQTKHRNCKFPPAGYIRRSNRHDIAELTTLLGQVEQQLLLHNQQPAAHPNGHLSKCVLFDLLQEADIQLQGVTGKHWKDIPATSSVRLDAQPVGPHLPFIPVKDPASSTLPSLPILPPHYIRPSDVIEQARFDFPRWIEEARRMDEATLLATSEMIQMMADEIDLESLARDGAQKKQRGHGPWTQEVLNMTDNTLTSTEKILDFMSSALEEAHATE